MNKTNYVHPTMPPVLSKPTNELYASRQQSNTNFCPPPVLLKPTEQSEPKKGDFLKIALRTNPTDSSSDTYSLNIRHFRTGTPEEFLKWRKDYDMVIRGQNLTNGPAKYAMARTLLQGDALRVFNNAASTESTETNENFQKVLNALTRHIFPRKALVRQKRYMRRQMRKPYNMKIRTYVARVREMNDDFPLYPPFDKDASLPDDELADIIEAGIPNSWQKAMLLHNFDVADKSTDELVEFCERLETAEEIYGGTHHPNKKRTRSNGNPKDAKKNGSKHSAKYKSHFNKKNRHDDDKDCPLHKDGTHTQQECKVLNQQAENMRNIAQVHWDKNARWQRKKPYGNKTWKRPKDDDKKPNDLNTMIETIVEKKLSQKRKSTDDDNGANRSGTFSIEQLSMKSDSDDSDSE